jgi:hypothetical protein
VDEEAIFHPWTYLFLRVSLYLPLVFENYHTDTLYWNLSGTKYRNIHREDNPLHQSANQV